jgi:protocatechuate 3,4-dioxygenase beta subunit
VDEKGKPVAGASVALTNGELATVKTRNACASGMSFISSGPVHTKTDDNGRFKFPHLFAGHTGIEVRQPGYRTAMVREVATGGVEIKITMMPPQAYTLTGTVHGPDAEPVGDAEVMLIERWHSMPVGGNVPRVIRTRSAANGAFALPDKLEPLEAWGLWSRTLFVHKAGQAVWGRRLDPTGAETEVVVKLPRAGEAMGRVVNSEEEPVADAEVWAWRVASPGEGENAFNYSQVEELAPRTRTNDKGEFRISSLPQDAQVTLFVLAPGYAKARYELKVVEADVEIELEREVILRGVAVHEQTGEPVAGLEVSTQGIKTSAWASTSTDEKGCFELRAITPEPTNLLATLRPPVPGAAPEWAVSAIVLDELEPGDVKSDLKLVLTKGGVIRGKVTDAAGHPLRGIDDIAFYSAARPREGAACQTCETGEDGTWAYRFPPGEVYVYIRSDIPGGTWSQHSYTLQLEAGETMEGIDFKLDREVPADSPHRSGKQAESSVRQ